MKKYDESHARFVRNMFMFSASMLILAVITIFIGMVMVGSTQSKADIKQYTKQDKCMEMTEENRPLLVGPDYLPKITEGVCSD